MFGMKKGCRYWYIGTTQCRPTPVPPQDTTFIYLSIYLSVCPSSVCPSTHTHIIPTWITPVFRTDSLDWRSFWPPLLIYKYLQQRKSVWKKRKWNLLSSTRALNELLCCPLSWPPVETDGSGALGRLRLCGYGLSEGYINAVSAHSFSLVWPEASQLYCLDAKGLVCMRVPRWLSLSIESLPYFFDQESKLCKFILLILKINKKLNIYYLPCTVCFMVMNVYSEIMQHIVEVYC